MYRVLIVEDEDTIRQGITFMMDWAAVDCVVVGDAADGEEGIKKIAALRPDIVVCDIRMPVKDGLAMLEESIGQYRYSAIVLSGYQDFTYAQKAIRLGVKEYLLKPIDFEELRRSILGITRQIHEQRQKQALVHKALENTGGEILPPATADAPAAGNRYVRAMLDYVKENYKTHTSLSELAEGLGASPGYLNAKFKQHTGHTFNDYLNRYRVSKALELLRQPGNPYKIYEIAEQVGITDYKYFSKVFKKYTGSSPLKFAAQEFENPEEPGQ